MQSRRHERVRELLIRALGEVVRRELPVAETGVITVTDVGLSSDLRSAVVFVSILGDDEQKAKGLSALISHRKHLQGLLGQAVVLKYTPKLAFRMDDSLARGDRVLNILEQIEGSKPNP